MPVNKESRVNRIVDALLSEQQFPESDDEDFKSGSAETFDSSTSAASILDIPEDEENEAEDESEDEEAALKALEAYRAQNARRRAPKYVDPALRENAIPKTVLSLKNGKTVSVASDFQSSVHATTLHGKVPTLEPIRAATNSQTLSVDNKYNLSADGYVSQSEYCFEKNGTSEYEQTANSESCGLNYPAKGNPAASGYEYPSDTLSSNAPTPSTQPQQTYFKVSAQDWAHHLAVTQIWNRMTYTAALKNTNIAAQDQYVYYTTRDERNNSIIWIRGDSRERVLEDYLEIVLNSQSSAKFVIRQIKLKTSPDDFWKLPDAKILPDDFDYRKQLDCYWRCLPVLVNYQYLTFDSNVNEQIYGTRASGEGVSKQVFAHSSLDEGDEFNKSVYTLISVQAENILPIEPGHFVVCHIPARRTYLNRFYYLVGTYIVQNVMSVNQQTDMLAKNFLLHNYKMDDTATFIIVDKKYFDLQLFDNTVLMASIRNCTQFSVIRGRGRSGKKLADLLARVRVIRPDLMYNEGLLFYAQRSKFYQTIEYKAQLNGTYLTMYGAYTLKEPKLCEIVDNPLEPMFIEEKVVYPDCILRDDQSYLSSAVQGNASVDSLSIYSREAQQQTETVSDLSVYPAEFIKRIYQKSSSQPIEVPIFELTLNCKDSGALRPEEAKAPAATRKTAEIISYYNGGDRETDVYRFFDSPSTVVKDGFKYHDPATGAGFNTAEEFKAIRTNSISAYNSSIQAFKASESEIREKIAEKDFHGANAAFYRQLMLIEPAWLRVNYQQRGVPDTAQRILGEARFGVIE